MINDSPVRGLRVEARRPAMESDEAEGGGTVVEWRVGEREQRRRTNLAWKEEVPLG